MIDSLNPQQVLIKYWGHSTFREKQEEIIASVLDGNDTLALLPTGGGKSICFQIPALMMEGICLVISPLIALMQDQVQNLKSKGIKAISITSAMSKREIDIALDNAAYGDFKFLYVSPERLKTDLFQARLKKMKVNSVAIDEAHCISQWGYDFRPAYLEIAKLKDQIKKIPFIALTATATPKVVEDIQEKLLFKTKNAIQKSFERSNLAYVVVKSENQLDKMLSVIDGVKGSGIIYVSSRKKTKEICLFLRQHKISADYYHAGLTAQEREQRQQSWLSNQSRIMVSTNAFGMGIDKPNVRFVIHLDLTESLEAYFQEAGRCGRDERKAYAVLILTPSMCDLLKERTINGFPEIAYIKRVYTALANFFQIPINGGENQSYEIEIIDFAKRYKFNILEVYSALHFLEKEGYITISENFTTPSRVHFSISKTDLYKFQVENRKYDNFVKGLLRSYGGLYEDFVKINENVLAKNLHISWKQTVDNLDRLKELEVIDYEKQSNKPKITYLVPRKDSNAVYISKVNYADRKKIAFEQCNSVINFVENTINCRSQMLLKYFGESDGNRCGICDVCLERNKLDLNDIEVNTLQKLIIKRVAESPINLKNLKIKGYSVTQIQKVVEFLLDSNQIITDGFKLSIERTSF